MTTLLLRFSGPRQGWSTFPALSRDLIMNAPRKFDVLGVLLQSVSEPVSVRELADLRFAVRVDAEGTNMLELAIEHVKRSSRWRKTANGLQRSRCRKLSYNLNATFVVGLEGDEGVLERIARGLRSPRKPVILGSPGCEPDGPLCLGLVSGDVLTALTEWEWTAPDHVQALHTEKVLPLFKEYEAGDSAGWTVHIQGVADVGKRFREEGFVQHKVVRSGDVSVHGTKQSA